MILAQILGYFNICLYRQRRQKDIKRLDAYVQAMVLWMLFCFLLTELLSLFHGINRLSLGLAWGLLDVGLLGTLLIQRKKSNARSGNKNSSSNGMQDACKNSLKKWSGYRECCVLVLVSVVVFVLALMTTPYNWDSMTYRLARVAHWAQNGSVEHYATNIIRAIANPPLGEFVYMHVYILQNGSDKLLNLVQCVPYITCTVLVYGIAKKIHCDKTFCFVAALLFQAMPIAFAEAVNTQVDLFSAVWLLGFVYLLLDFAQEEHAIVWSGENVCKVFVMGLCVAWGYLAKPSVCIAMVIFCVWLLITCIARKDKFTVLLRLAGCALSAMLITIPLELVRNLKTFHALSAPIAGARQLVGTMHPLYLFVNFLKNFIHNLPNPYLGQGRDFLETFTRKVANILRVDINALTIAEDGRNYGLRPIQDYGHDTAINPIIVWLFVICVIWAICRNHREDWENWYKSYSLTAAFAFLAFCVVLRWEPFVTRYMLVFLALLCPMIAFQLQKRTQGEAKRGLRGAVLGIVCCLCLLEIGNMAICHRNLCVRYGADERPYGYFTNRGDIYDAYQQMVQIIREQGYRDIGLRVGEDDYEYPYWSMLGDDIDRMEHVGVTNESVMYADVTYRPQCIIWHGAVPAETFVWNGQSYSNVVEVAPERYLLIAE